MGHTNAFLSLVGTLSNILAVISWLIRKKQPFCYISFSLVMTTF